MLYFTSVQVREGIEEDADRVRVGLLMYFFFLNLYTGSADRVHLLFSSSALLHAQIVTQSDPAAARCNHSLVLLTLDLRGCKGTLAVAAVGQGALVLTLPSGN